MPYQTFTGKRRLRFSGWGCFRGNPNTYEERVSICMNGRVYPMQNGITISKSPRTSPFCIQATMIIEVMVVSHGLLDVTGTCQC